MLDGALVKDMARAATRKARKGKRDAPSLVSSLDQPEHEPVAQQAVIMHAPAEIRQACVICASELHRAAAGLICNACRDSLRRR